MSRVIVLYGFEHGVRKVSEFLQKNNVVKAAVTHFSDVDAAVDQVFDGVNFPITVSENQIRKVSQIASMGVVSASKYRGQSLKSYQDTVEYFRKIAVEKSDEAAMIAERIKKLPEGSFVLTGPKDASLRDLVNSKISNTPDKVEWVGVYADGEPGEGRWFQYTEDMKSFRSSLLKILKEINKEWNGGANDGK